jgi:hypothetical protein
MAVHFGTAWAVHFGTAMTVHRHCRSAHLIRHGLCARHHRSSLPITIPISHGLYSLESAFFPFSASFLASSSDGCHPRHSHVSPTCRHQQIKAATRSDEQHSSVARFALRMQISACTALWCTLPFPCSFCPLFPCTVVMPLCMRHIAASDVTVVLL